MLESFKHYNIKNVGEEVTLIGDANSGLTKALNDEIARADAAEKANANISDVKIIGEEYDETIFNRNIEDREADQKNDLYAIPYMYLLEESQINESLTDEEYEEYCKWLLEIWTIRKFPKEVKKEEK